MDAVIGHNWPPAPVNPFSAHREIYVAHSREAPGFCLPSTSLSHRPELKEVTYLSFLCPLPTHALRSLVLGRRRWGMRQGNFEALDHSRGRPVSLVLLLTLGVLKQEELLRGGTAQKEGLKPQGPQEPCPPAMGEAQTELGRVEAGLHYFPRCAEVGA